MRVFVGGATGATGQSFVPAAAQAGLDLVVHVRPGSEDKYRAQQPAGPEPRVFDLHDADALASALEGCDVVLSMIGTMRKRFATGDTYQRSDIGTTVQLVAGALAARVPHFVLLGALGTRRLPGAYYDAKRAAEQAVLGSGLGWTMVRPSLLVGNGRGTTAALAFGGLRALPGLRGLVDDSRAIPVDVLARALVRICAAPAKHHGATVLGRQLWALGQPAIAAGEGR